MIAQPCINESPSENFGMGSGEYLIRKRTSFRKHTEIKGLRRTILRHAAPARSQVHTEIAEKVRFRTKT